MKSLYFVISSTDSKMGRFIQIMSSCPYNHVSLSFFSDFHDLQSFARYYYCAPFYGGFVHEGKQRYSSNTKILVYKIMVTDEQFDEIEDFILDMKQNKYKYLYNIIDAAFSVFKASVPIKNSYTCLSFALLLLKKAGIPADNIYSIKALIECLKPYLFYSGILDDTLLDEDTDYLQVLPLHEILRKTLNQNTQLFLRYLKKAES